MPQTFKQNTSDASTRKFWGLTVLLIMMLPLVVFGEDAASPNYKTVYEAISADDLPAVKSFLAEGVLINLRHQEGYTLLNYALAHGKLEVARYLVEAGADLTTQSERNYSDTRHFPSSVREVWENRGFRKNFTSMHYASRCGAADIVDMLIKRNAPVHLGSLPVSKTKTRLVPGVDLTTGRVGVTTQTTTTVSAPTPEPIHLAILNGHLRIAKSLIAAGAKLDASALNYAVRKPGNSEMIEYLINNGAPLNDNTSYHRTPLDTALTYGNAQNAKMLIQAGASKLPGQSDAYLAALVGDKSKLIRLLEAGLQINGANGGYTLLHKAAQGKQLAIVKVLIINGATANVPDEHGRSPAFYAAQNGSREILEVLSGPAALSGDTDRYGFSPLHAAAEHGHIDVVVFLLGHVPFDSSIHSRAHSPLRLAKEAGHNEVVGLLQFFLRKKKLDNDPFFWEQRFPDHPNITRLMAQVPTQVLQQLLEQVDNNRRGLSTLGRVADLLGVANNVVVNGVQTSGRELVKLQEQEWFIQELKSYISEHKEGHFDVVEVLDVEADQRSARDDLVALEKEFKRAKGRIPAEQLDHIQAEWITQIRKIEEDAQENLGNSVYEKVQQERERKMQEVARSTIKQLRELTPQKTNVEESSMPWPAIFPRHPGITHLMAQVPDDVLHEYAKEITVRRDKDLSAEPTRKWFARRLIDYVSQDESARLNRLAKVNDQDEHGRTELHYVALLPEATAGDAQLLITNGAEIDPKDSYGKTPLNYAMTRRNQPLVAYLVHQGADIRNVWPNPEKTFKELGGVGPTASLLIAGGVKIDTSDRKLLRSIAGSGGRFVITEAIKQGLDPNQRVEGMPLWHQAVWRFRYDTVAIFLDNGAKVDAVDHADRTALLIFMADHGKRLVHSDPAKLETTVGMFVQHGADPAKRDSRGNSPLSVAKDIGASPEIITTLEKQAQAVQQNKGTDTATKTGKDEEMKKKKKKKERTKEKDAVEELLRDVLRRAIPR